MSLLVTTIVFITLGCVYSQDVQFGQFGQDIDSQLAKYGKDIDKQLHDLGIQQNTNFEKQFSKMHFGAGNTQQSLQSSQIPNSLMPYVEESFASWASQCNEAGHPEVPQAIQNKIAAAGQCIQNKIEIQNLEKEFYEAARTHDLSSFFNKICTIWPIAHDCIQPIVSSVKLCFAAKDTETVDKSLDIIDATNSFFCENNANRIRSFIENQGFECIVQNKNEFEVCVANSKENIKKNANNGLVTYDEKNCGEIQNLRRCVVDKLRTCSSRIPAQIFDEYLGVVFSKVCNSASLLMWSSFVNIILLLVTYLYSNMF